MGPDGKYPERWFGSGEVGDESTEEASVSVSRDTCEEERERAVVALLSESSAECVDSFDEEVLRMVAISGALYDSMLVVDKRATGEEILARSNAARSNVLLVGLFILWERAGVDDDDSVRLMRLVTARARDMSID